MSRSHPRGARITAWALTLVVRFAAPVHAQTGERLELEARLGGAYNVPLPIVIRQAGHEDLRFTPDWRSRSFEPPLYYAWRITHWQGEGGGWALELVHHKLHLADPPPEIQSFAISHGYNLVTLQRIQTRGAWRYGLGLGVVAAHPESEVRNLRRAENQGWLRAGYHVGGLSAVLLADRTRAFGRRLVGIADARVTWSSIRVPIAAGNASVPNLALHASVGLAWAMAR